MYDNIGGKIKGLAKAAFIIGSIADVIIGINFMSEYYGEEAMVLIGLLIMIFGPLVALFSSWITYGFGELIDQTCAIARNTYGGERKSETQSKIDYERISKLDKLRSQGLITEEEYEAIRNEIIEKYEAQSKIDNERISELDKLRSQGLITEEECEAIRNEVIEEHEAIKDEVINEL